MSGKRCSLILLTGVMMVLSLLGCAKQKYELHLPGGFEAQKTSYAAGEKVRVTYPLVATDTDYSFYSDVDDYDQTYTDKDGYIFTFTMPARDVTFWMESSNSMFYQPEPEYTQEELAALINEDSMAMDYYDAYGSPEITARYTELVLYGWAGRGYLLARYEKEEGEPETMRVCRVPSSYYYECLAAINKNGARNWKNENSLTGRLYVIRFKEDGKVVRISSEAMPEGGLSVFRDFEEILGWAWEYYGEAEEAEDELEEAPISFTPLA